MFVEINSFVTFKVFFPSVRDSDIKICDVNTCTKGETPFCVYENCVATANRSFARTPLNFCVVSCLAKSHVQQIDISIKH